MAEEENFPRGGKVVRKRPPQENDTLFSVARPPKAKKQKKSKKLDQGQSSEGLFQSTLNIRGSLTYNKIQTGLVTLGCVRHIKNFALEIELPGLCFASVSITEISDPFTKHLNQQLESNEADTNTILSKMFSVGDFLPVKVIHIEPREKGNHIEASINPRDIYAEHNHNSFKKHMLVWSSIGSQADHGYEMSMGVKNCRAFLPSKNIDAETDYVIGRPLWCIVHKVDSTATATILRLSAKVDNIKSEKLEIENLHEIIPGMKVEFVTDKITAHGIQGKFSDNFIGYVEENYLRKPLKKPTDYQEGKILTAYVLFVEHATKITYLSLRFPERAEKPDDLNVGDIIHAEVFGKSKIGLFFMLPNKLKGFVTNKRVLKTLAKKDDINIAEAINAKYPIGSKHQCRILDYNSLTRTFICSPEFDVVKENLFAPKDLTPGQLVSVTVHTIKEEGIVVTTGHIRGFVPNMHISNTLYSSIVKKKFKEEQKVNARVLSVEGEKVLFTLKPALIEQEECLTKIEEAEVGKKYTGVVSKISETGALVVFYGNVKGWISQKGMGNEATDPSKYFFLGQVVNIYVWKVESTHMYLSLFRPQVKSALPNIGGKYCAVVTSVKESGIKIRIEDTERKGFVPNAHLSCSLSLCRAVKATFSPGDRIPELMYVGGRKPQIFSRRESLAMQMTQLPRLDTLEVGNILRCSYQSTSVEGIHVLPLIQDYTELVLVPKKDIAAKEIPELVEHQLLMAKIKSLDSKNKQLSLSVKLNQVFDKTVETTIDVFSQYLLELAYLYNYGKKHQWGICKHRPGDRVECIVQKVAPQGGCVVCLPDDVKGIAVSSLCPKNLQKGDKVTGVVIGRDYEAQFVDLCLKPDISGRINPVQDGCLSGVIASNMADKLLVKEECVISVLKHSNGNKQLVYLPTRLHENDFEGCMSYYQNKKFKICVCGKLKRFLVGMSKRMFLHLDESSHRNRPLVTPNIESEASPTEAHQKDNSSVGKRKRPPKSLKVDEIEKTQAGGSDSGIEHEEDNELIEPNEINEVDVELESKIEAQVQKSPDNVAVSLPGASAFFNPCSKLPLNEESSSEDEDNSPTEKKKKKLTPAERAELLRQEEERISKIEKDLADPTRAPESAEQFDRVLLSKPNSSELWAKYIAFHIAATEIDKARAVAKRALDTINMTLTEEKFQIWMVLLNLENMFGTKESFDKTFEDALKFNDSLQVYLKVIAMLAENAKYSEMEEKINKARAKHKQEPNMWLEVAKTYYQIGKFKEARHCKDRALKSITDKKSQMNIIVRFAIMEFKYGEQDQGCAIFETILTTDPRKINIWSIYVDQLVKKERIEEARQVLERSVCQSLPLKSMKSLFMKFRKFEEVQGSPDTVQAVKQRAHEYVVKFERTVPLP